MKLINKKQQTIKQNITFNGIGIHTGKISNITLMPAPENAGITFIRVDKQGAKIPCSPEYLVPGQRATILEKNGCRILTPEHLLASLHCLSITNIDIYINNEEIPILDGSASNFIDIILKAIPTEQSKNQFLLKIKHPIVVSDKQSQIIVLPSDTTKYSYFLKSPEKFINNQGFHLFSDNTNWSESIGKARTWAHYNDIKGLLDKGLAQGGSLENAVIFKEDGYINKLRYKDELIRHKILDLVGDTWILGKRIIGHVIGFGSGHALNTKLVQELSKLQT